MLDGLYQKTLLNQVTFNGIGLHTGKDVEMTVYPASVNSGISFVINGVKTPANISHLHNTQYCTSLKHHGQEVKIRL